MTALTNWVAYVRMHACRALSGHEWYPMIGHYRCRRCGCYGYPKDGAR